MTEGNREDFTFKYNNYDDEIDYGKNLKVGQYLVIKVHPKDLCLTCSGVRRLYWIEMEGNKKNIKWICLFCKTRVHTAANRIDP